MFDCCWFAKRAERAKHPAVEHELLLLSRVERLSKSVSRYATFDRVMNEYENVACWYNFITLSIKYVQRS